MIKKPNVRLERHCQIANKVTDKNYSKITRHYKGRQPNAVLVTWLGYAPKRHHAERKDQRLSNQPCETQAFSSKTGDDFTHHQGRNDAHVPANPSPERDERRPTGPLKAKSWMTHGHGAVSEKLDIRRLGRDANGGISLEKSCLIRRRTEFGGLDRPPSLQL